ncbi:MAG: bifunctional (p)ppGpp synthetase/guanosine-3',5'-bis(diphosphate) 3'-pyrophosphohydrolase [Tissierellia bacterium]|nr:bifunctional (p)ppGpp synthetase/guanosine-3',5'-bis(diphosphate) 3'-pyrophosphohydrolase [Tissierellia bacterium]
MAEVSLSTLIEKIKSYNQNADIEMVSRAFKLAEKFHEGQFRSSGEPYFTHPYHVALILTELNMDVETIVSGLMHDLVEDTEVTKEQLTEDFSEEVAYLVDGVTKLTKMKYKTKQENQAENIRKMVLAMARDIRVIIVKLADRLHNMRTLEYMTPEKKKEKAMETLEIYAPLAHRLGISKIKWELEDLSLRYLDFDNYYDLVEKVNKRRVEREALIEMIIQQLKTNLDQVGIQSEIQGRPKNFYSIYKKMTQQGKLFEEIYDLTAVRVLVNDIKDCYGVLGIVHTLWKPIPGRFKDYIAMPKANMYQSLHTTVIDPHGEIFEVQIRTWDMHRTAEYGIAAHWKYKEGSNKETDFDAKLTWLRQLLDWQNEMNDPTDFMETLKVDYFSDEVFVFTPRGDVINLPEGSTPIDFAYRVHSAVGNHCVGAKVNGRIVPLNHELSNGNIVEVITSPNASPSYDWLKIVKSNQARSKIRQYFKGKNRDQNIQRGKDALDKEIKKFGQFPKEYAKEELLKRLVERFKYNYEEDLLAAIGYGNINSLQIVARLKDIYDQLAKTLEKKKTLEDLPQSDGDKAKEKSSKSDAKASSGVVVKGIDNLKVRLAKCCNPLPGDAIIGFVTRGRGVSVHRADCTNLYPNADRSRFLDVEWSGSKEDTYNADVQLIVINRPGILAEIATRINDAKVGLSSLSSKLKEDGIGIIDATLNLHSIDELDRLLNSLRSIKGVLDVNRVSGK